jgi:hypothetical protein
VAETDIAIISFVKILGHIMSSSELRVIRLYPGKALELPKVLKEQPADIATVTYQGVKV